MSNTIDQKVVEMRFDNRQFESGAAESMSTIDKLKQKLKFDGATKGLENVNSAANKIDFKKIENTACDAGFRIQDVWTKTASVLEYQIAGKLINIGKNMASALTIDPIKTGFQEYETQINAVQTILANTQSKGSTLQDVNKALDELNLYADKTIYNFTEMTRNIGTFTAAGVDLQTSVDSIQGIANLAAVSGSTSQQAATAMYQLSQALSSGTVKLMDWNSVVNAGMGGEMFQNALKETSALLGTGAEAAIEANGSFRESLRTGWLTSEVLTETLKKFTTTGAYERVAEYTGLSKEAVKAALESAEAQYGEADAIEHASKALAEKSGKSADEIKQTLQFAKTAEDAATKVKTFSQLWDVMKESAQSGWSQTWKIIVGDFEEAKALLTPLADFFTGVIGKISDTRNRILQIALDFAAPWNAIKDKISNVKKVVDGITSVTDKLGYFQEVVNKVWMGDYNNQGDNPDRRDLLKAAGYDPRVVQHLVNLGEESWKAGKVYKLSVDEIEAAHKKFGLTMEAGKEETESVTSAIEKLSDEQLKNAGLTDDEIALYRALEKEAKRCGISMSELADEMSNNNGRDMLIESFKNIGDAILGIGKACKDAWVDIFNPPSTEEVGVRLYGMIRSFKEFTESLRLTDEKTGELNETGKKFQRIFKGVFAALDIGLTLVGGPLQIAFKLLVKVLKACNVDILELVAKIGDAIVKFRDWIDSVLDFEKIFKAIPKYIRKAVDAFQDWIKKLKKSDNIPLQIIKDLGSGFSKAISYIGKSITKFADFVLEKIENLFGIDLPSFSEYAEIGKNMIDGLINGLGGGLQKVFNFMINLGKSILEKIKSVLGIHSPSTEFFAIGGDIIKGLFNGISEGASLVWDLVKTVGQKIIDIVKNLDIGTILTAVLTIGGVVGFLKIANFLGAVVGPLDGVSDALKAFTTNIKAESLKAIATAIAILVGAVVLLALLPYGKVWSSVGAIVALGVVLALLSAALGKWGPKESKDFMTFAGSIVVLAAAMLILSIAIKKISDLSIGQATIAVVSMIACLGALLGVVALMKKVATPRQVVAITKASIVFSSIAIAIGLLAYVCKTIATSEWINNFEFSQNNPVIKALEVMGLIAVGLGVTARIIGPATKSFGGSMLKLAIAIALIALVCKQCSKIDFTSEEWTKVTIAMVGLLVVVGILALIGKSSTKVIDKESTFVKLGSTVLALAVSIGILALTAKLLASISWEGLAKGLVGISVFSLLILALTKVVAAGGNKVDKLGRTILAMSGAIALLAGVAVLLGLVNIKTLAQGIIAVGLLSAMMAGLMYCAQYAKGGMGPIIAMVAGITILATTLVVLGQIQWQNLVMPVIAMTTVMGMLAILMKSAGSINKSSMGSIIALTAALAVMGAALFLLSKNPWQETLSAAVALGGLMVILSTVVLPSIAATANVAGQALVGIGLLTLMVIPLLAFVGVLALMSNVQNALTNALALSVLVGALSLAMIPLTGIGAAMASGAPLLGVTALLRMAIPLLAFVGILALMNKIENATQNVMLLSTLLGVLTAVMVVLAFIGPAAMIGIGALTALAALIGGIGLVVVAIGALTEKFPAIQTFVDTGIGLLERLASGIGSVIGKFIDGFLTSATENLPAIGTRLSEFMTNLTPFLNGVKMVDDGLLGKVGSIAGAIGLLTAANLLTQISEFITNGESFSRLGTELSAFMINAMPFITGASMLNETMTNAVRSLAETILILTGANILEGLTSWITGGSSFASFGSELGNLGSSMNAFITNLGTFGEEQLNTVKCACEAIKALASAASEIPNEGGWVAAICGENSLASFGDAFPNLGTNMSKFVTNLGTFTDEQVSTVECAGSAIKTLADAAGKIPNEGGLWAKICGDNSLATFGSKLPGLATHIKNFVTNLGTFGEDKIATVKSACDVIKQIAKLGDTNMSGLSSDLDDLGKTLNKFADKLKKFCKDMSAVASSDIKSATDKVMKLVTLAKDLSGTNISSLENFGKTLKKIAKDGVIGFIEELSGDDPIDKVKKAAEKLVKTYSKAIKEKKEEAEKAFKTVASEGVKGAKSESAYTGFTKAGKYMVEGFANGITKNDFKAEAAAAAMAKAAKLAAEKALGIASPAKEMKEDGEWTVEGFVEGIEDKLPDVSNAGENVADAFTSGFNDNISTDSMEAKVNASLDENSLFKKLYSLKRELNSGKYDVGSSEYNELTNAVASTQKEITDANKKYYEDLETLDNDHKQKVLDNINELTTAYDDAIKERAEAIKGTYGLFDAVEEKEKVKGQDLIDNLMDQWETVATWESNMNDLADKGILNGDLLSELRQMGPDAAAEIAALNEMSMAQLTQYNNIYEMKARQATNIAKSELQTRRAMTTEEIAAFEEDIAKLSSLVDEEGNRIIDDAMIAKLRESAAFSIEDDMLLSGKLHETLGVIETEYDESLTNIRKTWSDSIGITVEETTDQFSTMIEDLINQAGEQTQWSETGASMIEGLNKGIIDHSSTLCATVSKVMREAVKAAMASIDAHSPSRVFAEIGQFMDMGVVVGLKNYLGRVTTATADVGKRAISAMSDVVSGAQALISSDVDMQPTIRPVLDLSNIRSGSRTIGELMGSGASFGVNANVGVISSLMSNRRQNGTNNDVVSAINDLRGELGRTGNSYNINGIQYNEGSEVAEAIETLVRAARIERRT